MLARGFVVSNVSSHSPAQSSQLRPTLSSLDRKEMKSAHSLTFSNNWRHLSTCAAYFLYLPSLASKDAAAASR